MVNNWLILTVIAGLSSVIFNSVNRATLRNGRDSTVYAWLFELIRFIFFAAFIPLDNFLVCGTSTTLILISLGFTELIGVYLYMKMHSHTELSVSSVISRLRVLFVPMLAFLFLGERLTLLQYVGVVTVFAGCLTVVGIKDVRHTKGIWYAIAFALVNSISNILMKAATPVASPTIIAAAFSFPSAILIPVIMKGALSRIKISTAPILRSTLVASAFNIITMYALVSAFALSSSSQVNSVFQGITTLAVVVGILLFNEHSHKRLKILGAIITTAGIMLLI